MKLISWNIDSLNAALTSDSARAKLSQDVLQTLVAEDADIIANPRKPSFQLKVLLKNTLRYWKNSSQATKTPGALLKSLPVKAMLEPCSSIRKNSLQLSASQRLAHLLLWTWKAASLLWNLINVS